MWDFDIMMQRTKEENRKLHNKRRRPKDIEMINDNDDAIAKLLADMRLAAHEDRELNLKGEPAIKKLAMLSAVKASLAKVDLRLAFVEANILSVITDWLAPLPKDKCLPCLPLRYIRSSMIYKSSWMIPFLQNPRLKSEWLHIFFMRIFAFLGKLYSNSSTTCPLSIILDSKSLEWEKLSCTCTGEFVRKIEEGNLPLLSFQKKSLSKVSE